MKHIWILFFAATITFSSCNGQDIQNKKHKLNDVQNTPKANVKVNKEYDKNGNLVKYDSTYTYFYTNIVNDSLAKDSIFNNFKNMIESKYSFSHKPFFNDLFFEDSLMKYDFYKEDFFSERFKRNMEQAEEIFKEMDSIKNRFFMDQFPKNKRIE